MITISLKTGEVGISPMPQSMHEQTGRHLSVCKKICSIDLCAQLVMLLKGLEDGGFTKEEVMNMVTTASTVFVEKGDEIE